MGSRWIVPRGPKVRVTLPSASAARTVARVAPGTRSATDSSAAEAIWAWAPCIAATAPDGV